MATCFCKQPCEKHKFPVIRSKKDALRAFDELLKQEELSVRAHMKAAEIAVTTFPWWEV